MRINILTLGLICLFLILFPYCKSKTPITPETPAATTTTTTTTTLPAVVQPGEWTANTDFGVLDFTVSSDSNYITEVKFTWSNWRCGGVVKSGSVSISKSPGCPISNRSFEFEDTFYSGNEQWTIIGTFSEEAPYALCQNRFQIARTNNQIFGGTPIQLLI